MIISSPTFPLLTYNLVISEAFITLNELFVIPLFTNSVIFFFIITTFHKNYIIFVFFLFFFILNYDTLKVIIRRVSMNGFWDTFGVAFFLTNFFYAFFFFYDYHRKQRLKTA